MSDAVVSTTSAQIWSGAAEAITCRC